MKKHSIIASIIIFAGAVISSWIKGWVDIEDKLMTALGVSIVFYILDATGFNWGEKNEE